MVLRARSARTLRLSLCRQQACFDLGTAWRGASNTHYIPWLLIATMKSYADGIGHKRLESYRQFVDALDRTLNDALTTLGMPAEKRWMVRNRSSKPLQDWIGRLAAEEVPFEIETLWGGLKVQQEFGISLWALARSCFVTVYYAYEDFIRCCVALVSRRHEYRIRRFADTSRDLASYFGREVVDSCWQHSDVDIARRVRNAIVHNGSRRTDELDQVKHDYEYVDGEIVILASHVRRLFEQLKLKASTIAASTIDALAARTTPIAASHASPSDAPAGGQASSPALHGDELAQTPHADSVEEHA